MITSEKSVLIGRTEKITSATYMVTSFLPDPDPLKTKIRERSTDLLSEFYLSRTLSFYERVACYEKIIEAARDIVGFLSVAFSVNFVSEMNYSILKKEYELLVEKLEAYDEIRSTRGNALPLSDSFFVPKDGHLSLSSANSKELIHKGQDILKDRNRGIMSFRYKETRPLSGLGKDKKKVLSSFGFKSDRKDSILKIIRKKGDVTIKDISSVISGCSEKTIQRELLVLVSGGILKKEGEKRWSKYSLT